MMWCIAGPERGDAGVHRIGIAALVRRDDLVVLLGGVERFGELDDDVVVAAGHRMPPLDLGLRQGGLAPQDRGEN
jgi:hypothetical protein